MDANRTPRPLTAADPEIRRATASLLRTAILAHHTVVLRLPTGAHPLTVVGPPPIAELLPTVVDRHRIAVDRPPTAEALPRTVEGAARRRITAGAEHPLTTVVAAGADRTPTLVAVVVEALIAEEVVVEVDTPRLAAATEAIANSMLG